MSLMVATFCKKCFITSELYWFKTSAKTDAIEACRTPCGCGGGLRKVNVIEQGCLYVWEEAAV